MHEITTQLKTSPQRRPQWLLLSCIFVCALLISSTGCKRRPKHSIDTRLPPRTRPPVQDGAARYPIKVKDDRGKEITIPRSPRRIVVGGTALYTEILLDLGAKDRIVGVADSPNTPKGASGLASVGRPWPLNVERVLALRPDIVFCAMAKSRQKLEQDAKIKVFTGGSAGGFIKTVDDLFSLIGKIDLIVHGHQRRSKSMLQRIEKGLQTLSSRVEERKPVDVAIAYIPQPQSSRLYVIGPTSSPGSSLLRRAKGNNVFADHKGGLVGMEALIARDPEVLITDPKHVKRVYDHRAFQQLRAVKRKRVIGIPASHYTSSRLLRVFRQLIKALHPNIKLAPSPKRK